MRRSSRDAFREEREIRPRCRPPSGIGFPADQATAVPDGGRGPHDREEDRQDRDRGRSACSDHVHHDRAVAAALGIVVVAVEEDLGRRKGADPVAGRLDQAEAQVARRVLDSVEVARQAAVRRRDVDGRRVGDLPLAFVVLGRNPTARVMRSIDRLPGQEMPAAGRAAA